MLSHSALFSSTRYTIPRLQLLDEMVAKILSANMLANIDLQNTYIVGVQHILETTVTLFDALNKLGIPYKNMFFSGKCYSTAEVIAHEVRARGINLMPSNKPDEPGEYDKYCRKGITHMWEVFNAAIRDKQVDRIIVLDEGGRSLEGMPSHMRFKYQVAAIEQTRAGLFSNTVNLLPFPLIEVASSAAKVILEPPLIATAIVNRFKSLLKRIPFTVDTVFGVIGNGAIGRGLITYLLSLDLQVIVYDEDQNAFHDFVEEKNFIRLGGAQEVFANATIVFGCTGKDITSGLDMRAIITRDTTLISCTSEDKEFKSLLQTIARQSVVSFDTLSDITCTANNGSKINILQGGFPFNFDRKPWNVPAEDIEVTQGLLLGSCVQAMLCANKPKQDSHTINRGDRQILNPYIQQFVALHWLARQRADRYSHKVLDIFSDIHCIKQKSGSGIYKEDQVLLEFCNKNWVPRAKL